MKKPINTELFSQALRRKGIDPCGRRVLITRFDGSEQARDFTLPANCGGFGRVHHFRRFQGNGWPCNPLPIDPALKYLGLPSADIVQVQVFQSAFCSWRCWYCFVDFDLLSADPRYSELKTADELLDLYCAESDPTPIIDLSGGQPDLVPEWILWFSDSLEARRLNDRVYLWSDDNLSNDFLWRYLSVEEIQRLCRRRNYGRVGCFKGFDAHSFSFNTGAHPEMFSVQFQLMRRLVDAGFDVYGYVTLTSDTDAGISSLIASFVDRLQCEVHPLFPLRTIPLMIREFTPARGRIGADEKDALKIQGVAVSAWREELEKRFSSELRTQPICEHSLEKAQAVQKL